MVRQLAYDSVYIMLNKERGYKQLNESEIRRDFIIYIDDC